MDRIFNCESLQNIKEIDPFLERLVADEVTYDNVNRKRSWSNHVELVQTVAEPGLTVRKVLLCVRWYWRRGIYYEFLHYGQTLIRFHTINNWTIWRRQLPRSGQLLPIGEKLSSIRTRLARSYGRLVGMFLCIHLIVRF